MPSKRVDVCVNCSKPAIIVARGRCVACYGYLWRTGEDRPKSLINKRVLCKDCKVSIVLTKGRCNACHLYFITNGIKRPVHLRNKDTANCKNPNCRKPLRLCVSYKGRCSCCYFYHRKYNGVERPATIARFELAPGYIACANPNCDKPVTIGMNWTRRRHRCAPCYKWLIEHGEDRPREFCSQRVTEMGWCECGNVASKEFAYEFGANCNRNGKMFVCDECYKLEMDYQKGVLA